MRPRAVHVVSGATRHEIAALAYPDWYGDYGATAAVGDVDGDGCDDLAVGEPNYHLPGPGEAGFDGRPMPRLELGAMTLDELLELQSAPRSLACESGCALVYSGRTRPLEAAQDQRDEGVAAAQLDPPSARAPTHYGFVGRIRGTRAQVQGTDSSPQTQSGACRARAHPR